MRIPTYSFKKTQAGLEVYGPGSSRGNVFPNLVFVRGKDYRFLFWNNTSVVEFFDKEGHVLFSANSEEYYIPVIFRFGNNYPTQIRYRFKNATEDQYGNINIRDLDKISGRVISYGYSKNSSVTDNMSQTLTTTSAGKFELNLQSRLLTEFDTYFVNFDLYSSGGFDASVLNVNAETYSDELLFSFRAKSGCLHINSLSTLFWFIDKKLIKTDYRDIENKMQNYFGFSKGFDATSDDPIFCYLTDKISLSDFNKFILITCIIEYEITIHADTNSSDEKFAVYDRLAEEILDGDKKFSYINLNNLITESDHLLYNSFVSAFLVLSSRMFQLSDKNVKKVCVLESVYNLIYKFRNSIFKKIVSYEMFLSDDFSVNGNSIAIPKQSYSMLLSYVDGCSIAPFGKYAKIDITPELIRGVLNQTLPVEPEITNKLLNKTLYIKYDYNDYFCYKIIDYIDYEYELKTISSSQVIHGFESSLECCTLETISAQSLQEKNISLELDVAEKTLLEIKLFSMEKKEIFSLEITNKNKPFSNLFDQPNIERYYIDEHLPTKINSPVPALVAIPKIYTTQLKDRDGISIAYDGKLGNYTADHIRYDYNVLHVENATLVDVDILTLDTAYPHGYKRGEVVIIKNSSKDGLLNGTFNVAGVTGKTITLDFNLPSGKTDVDINGSYGEIESLNFTKIYTDVRDFAVHDVIFFEQFNEGVEYKVSVIKKDYIGDYLVVSGVVPRNCKNFTRKSRIPITKTLKYSRSYIPEIYELKDISTGNPLDLNKYDIFSPSQPGTIAAAVFVKLVSHVELKQRQETAEIAGINLPIIDLSVRKPVFMPTSDEILPEPLTKAEVNEVAYHFSRSYLKKDFELSGHDEVNEKTETFDWNGDGVIGKDELKILERVLLTRPRTVEEYNLNRENYPYATVLPNMATGQYACQEFCCHDDFTETDEFTIDDVYIYDAFQAYLDTIGQTSTTEYQGFLDHYDALETQGISPWLFDEMVYMPTNPAEKKYCADYTDTGTITADDAHIYFAHHMYVQERGEAPDSMYRFERYYSSLVTAGMVPELLVYPEKLPSLASEDTITGADVTISKACDQIGQKDLVIYYEWLRQGKPTDLEEFNIDARSFTSAIPTACFLPVDEEDYAPDEYEDFGFQSFSFGEVYEGLENL